MYLSVGTNFDDKLLEKIANTSVRKVYGKLADDIFGGGRPTMALPQIQKEDIKRHIQIAHSYGIEFDYLINANCMDNLEFQTGFNEQLFKTIEWLDNIDVDWITVSIPYLVEVIKSIAPRIRVSLSTFAYVDTLQKALEFEKLGVDEITLPEGLNRNFPLLEKLIKNCDIQFQLIATNLCLAACPYRIYHSNSQAHASQKGHVTNGVTFDYCMLKCTEKVIRNPVEAIKSPWIRPEDISVYEKIGIENFKITERMKKTEVLEDIVKSYTNRRYEGNLNRLLNFRVKEDFIPPTHDSISSTEGFNSKYFYKSREILFERKIEINNRALDGFIDFFVKTGRDCRNELCGIECYHCHNFARKAISVDKERLNKAANEIASLISDVANGYLYKDQSTQELSVSKELLDLLEVFLSKKPEFVRKSSKIIILEDSMKYAKKHGRKEVILEDLLIANYQNTPREFRDDFINLINSLNLHYNKMIFDSMNIEQHIDLTLSDEQEKLIEIFLSKKPEFVRESSRKSILEYCRKILTKENRSKITIDDIIISSYENTPLEFRHNFLTLLTSMDVQFDKSILEIS
jgi:collagenase-like PrtC family protease/predicted Zn-dependent protease with MMP-like domain